MIKMTVRTSIMQRVQKALTQLVDINGTIAANRLLDALVLNTPIKTGYARSRWTLQQDGKYTMRFNVSTSSTLFGESAWSLSNDAPYIIYLNRGSSKQAPPFFIEQTILEQGFRLNDTLVNTK